MILVCARNVKDMRVLLADNHDLISLKLYQLTVLRSKLEEEEEEEDIKVPSVDNVDLMKRMCPAKSVS